MTDPNPKITAEALRRVAKAGRLNGETVLAASHLSQLPSLFGGHETEPEGAVLVAEALLRIIDSSTEGSVLRALFGVDDTEAHLPLAVRRARAAELCGLTPESFRVRGEMRYLESLARSLLVELAARVPAGAKRSGAHLEIDYGATAISYSLDASRGTVLLGRDSQCDIELRQDYGVSRRHARLVSGARGWTIEDLGSTNGTHMVEGRTTSPTLLSDGDVFTIGTTRITYVVDDDDPFSTVEQ